MSEDKASSILVVEDDSLVASDIRSRLHSLGFASPPTVDSAQAAFTCIEKNTIDLVLMDIALSGDMDGIRAAKLIRDSFDIPVIFITANSDTDIVRDAQSGNPYGFLIKPVNTAILNAAITTSFHLKKMERRQALTAQILGILNASGSLDVLLDMVLSNLVKDMGFEAIGIRLQKGDTYSKTLGFPLDMDTDTETTYRSSASIPIRAGDKNIGFLDLHDRRPDLFDAELLSFLEGIGSSLGSAFLRKDAEELLSRREALLEATQHLAKIGGWEWDVENQSMFWMDETYRIHDLDPEDFTAGSLAGSPEHIALSMQCYLEKDRPIIDKAFKACAEEGISYDLELPFISARGRHLWIRTSAKPIFTDEKIIGVSGQIMDITERKTIRERTPVFAQHRV
ncbi:hypothetical protein MASR2M78_25840 [Treponema sp.]